MTENEQTQREAVIAAARTWVGTPYHDMGKVKGVGVDCGTLLASVYQEAGVVPQIVLEDYSPQWYLHRDDPRYLDEILKYAHEIETPAPGDVVVYRIGRQFAHGAIIVEVEPMRIIHAWSAAKCVLEGYVSEFAELVGQRKGRGQEPPPRKFFNPW